MNEKIINRLFTYLKQKGMPHTRFEKEIGLSNGYLKIQEKRNADLGESVICKIVDNCLDIDIIWLLTGRGSMLRNSKNTEETKLGCTPNATPISPAEESVIYKMYKDEKEETKALIRENGRLEERLRSMEQELSAFKSKHELHPEPLKRAPKSSDPAKPAFTKQPSSPNADNVTSAIVP